MIDTSVLWDLAKMAGAGLTAGLFAAYVSGKDYRFKKWWEMRVAAYQSAIEALSDFAYAYDVRYRALLEGRELSDEREEVLGSLVTEAFHRVRKATDSGAFLFSAEANAALATVVAEWDADHQSYQDHLDSLQFVAKQCLNRLVVISKVDLNLHRNFWIWK